MQTPPPQIVQTDPYIIIGIVTAIFGVIAREAVNAFRYFKGRGGSSYNGNYSSNGGIEKSIGSIETDIKDLKNTVGRIENSMNNINLNFTQHKAEVDGRISLLVETLRLKIIEQDKCETKVHDLEREFWKKHPDENNK